MKLKMIITLLTMTVSVLAAPIDDRILTVKNEITQTEQQIKNLKFHDNGNAFQKPKSSKTKGEKELEVLKEKLKKLNEDLKRLENLKSVAVKKV